MFTDGAILVGMLYVYLPLMVLPLYASMEKLDFRLVEAGYDLYATRFQVLRRVIIPLVKPGIIAGSILVFIPSLGAYVTPRVLGGGKNMMLGNLIELQFGQGRNWPLGSALSMTLHGHRHGGAARLCAQCRQIGRGRPWLRRMPAPAGIFSAPADRLHRHRGRLLHHALPADRHARRLFVQRRRVDRDLGGLFAGAGTSRPGRTTRSCDAAMRSLMIASFAAVIATIAATMAALATTRTAPYPRPHLHLCHDQPAADGAGDRHRRGAADLLLRTIKICDRLFRPRLSRRRAHGLLHPLRLSADPGAAREAWT